jgi:hypothetical protein
MPITKEKIKEIAPEGYEGFYSEDKNAIIFYKDRAKLWKYIGKIVCGREIKE